jgi:RNase P/RNase MRP subunit p30
VTCNTKNIARDAARDTRVDIIRFPTDNRRRTVWMDRQQATLAAEYGCHYEIETAELLAQDPAVLSETLRILRRELKNANKNDVPIILSSGAPDIYGLRAPRDMASLMELLDVDEVEALDMVSANPWAIVEGNRDKLSGRSVLPGVSRVE